MKITFEGPDIGDILDQMSIFVADVVLKVRQVEDPEPDPVRVERVEQELRAPWPTQVAKPAAVNKPVDKPKRERTEKQLANDEKLRIAAREKMAAKKAAKAATGQMTPMTPMPEPEPEPQPEPFAEPTDPAEIVKLRTRTIEELQAAYADGHQKEVFELLSRFGNGAKSFRELPPEAFPPIRRAIDLGALEGARE